MASFLAGGSSWNPILGRLNGGSRSDIDRILINTDFDAILRRFWAQGRNDAPV